MKSSILIHDFVIISGGFVEDIRSVSKEYLKGFSSLCECLVNVLGLDGRCLKNMYLDAIVTTPTTTQHILNTVVGLDMKMTLQTAPPPHPP